nr:hypothetical protein [Halorubrum sp. CGM5_25_10-8B]
MSGVRDIFDELNTEIPFSEFEELVENKVDEMGGLVDEHAAAILVSQDFDQGKEGASLDQYVRIANDILFNPEGTIERVEQAYEQQLEADGDDGSQASLAGERALASIERVSDDLQEKVEQFEEREDALRERFQEAMG